MTSKPGKYRSDGHFGEIVENPHSGLRFMVIAKHRANPDAWEGRLAIVVRLRDRDSDAEEIFRIGSIHHISPHGWKRVDE